MQAITTSQAALESKIILLCFATKHKIFPFARGWELCAIRAASEYFYVPHPTNSEAMRQHRVRVLGAVRYYRRTNQLPEWIKQAFHYRFR